MLPSLLLELARLREGRSVPLLRGPGTGSVARTRLLYPKELLTWFSWQEQTIQEIIQQQLLLQDEFDLLAWGLFKICTSVWNHHQKHRLFWDPLAPQRLLPKGNRPRSSCGHSSRALRPRQAQLSLGDGKATKHPLKSKSVYKPMRGPRMPLTEQTGHSHGGSALECTTTHSNCPSGSNQDQETQVTSKKLHELNTRSGFQQSVYWKASTRLAETANQNEAGSIIAGARIPRTMHCQGKHGQEPWGNAENSKHLKTKRRGLRVIRDSQELVTRGKNCRAENLQLQSAPSLLQPLTGVSCKTGSTVESVRINMRVRQSQRC